MRARELVLLWSIVALPLFADDPAVYQGADSVARTKIALIDRMVAEKKYESAYQLVSQEEQNPFLVAKRVELATNYFVQSINHKVFAFKDLAPGESLDSLRAGQGSFSLYSFDPEATIQRLLSTGDRPPILYKALGDYFFDVSLRYQGRWTEDDQTILQKCVSSYQKAIDSGLVTATILTNAADKAVELGDFPRASLHYKRALELDPTLLNVNFNFAYASLMLGNYDLALSQGDVAIGKYARDPQYQMDALLLCADAAFFSKKYDLSLGYLDRALNISREDYRVFRKLGKVYLGQGNIERADESLDRLFAFAPTNPSVTQMASEAYLGVNNLTALLAFYKRNIAKYQSLPEAQGNLYFHLGLQHEADGKPQESLLAAKKAKEAFSKANKYDGPIKEAVDALLARVS